MNWVRVRYLIVICGILIKVATAREVGPKHHKERGSHKRDDTVAGTNVEGHGQTTSRSIDTVPILSDQLSPDKLYNNRHVGFNFHVAFVTYNASTIVTEKEYKLICSGALIDSTSILSAANCALSIKMAIRIGHAVEAWLGVADLRIVPSSGQRRDIQIKNLHWHKEFNAEKHSKNDIAVINMEPFPPQFSSPICFTQSDYDEREVALTGFASSVCNASDYSKNLLHAKGQVYFNTACNKMADTPTLTKSQACVVTGNGTTEKVASSSPGDVGGAIFYPSGNGDGSLIVVGIVSMSRKRKGVKDGECEQDAYMGVYTRPDRYKSFIQKWAPMANFKC